MKFTRQFSFLLALVAALAFTACNSNTKTGDTTSAEAPTTPPPAADKNPSVAANGEAAVPVGPTTTMKFEAMDHDFGKITDGDRVQHTFKFTNTGEEPLMISNCKATCGCTVPECPKEPIAPGEAGEITVEYNSRNKAKNHPDGKADTKFINITANTEPAVTRLTIKAFVMQNADQLKEGVQ